MIANQPTPPVREESEHEQGSLIDFKRIGYRALAYWYLIVLCLAIALSVALYINRYSQRIYPVTASVIIREREETSGGELLYKNALIDPYRNYLNEPFIIKSYPLIRKVVEELDFSVTFFREGFLLTTEAYDYVPVQAKLIQIVKPSQGKFTFKVKSEKSYSLEPYENSDVAPQEFHFGDTIEYDGYRLWIAPAENRKFGLIDVPFLMVVRNPSQVTSEYVSKLNVSWAEEGAGVLNLSVNGANPAKEIDFLNGLVRHYQQYDLDKKNQAAERSIEFIRGQLTKITDSLKIFEGQLQQFKKSNRTSGSLSKDGELIFTRIEKFETEKAELTIKSSYYDYLKRIISEDKNLDQVILPSSLGISDPVLGTVLAKLTEAQLEIKTFQANGKSSNPLYENRVNRLNELKREVLESVNSLRTTDKIKLDFLDKQILNAEKQLGYLPVAERQLISIQRNYSLLETLYVFLMQKMSEAGISKASNVSDIIGVNPPMRGGAISPKTSTNLTIAMVIGLSLPLVILILIEIFNTKIQSSEDIARSTHIPFIGGVGHNPIVSNLIVVQKPKSSVSESFRALRSNLNFFTGHESNKVFMITSSISGEGKTFTTINLATVFALSGRRTLIIGADMRRPKIYMDFNMSNQTGLSGFLSNLSTFDEIIQKTSIQNLDLVSGGPVPPNPSELLLTARFDEFMKEAKSRYDFVLIDTPPLALVTDAFVMAKFADHTVFVMRQNYTPKAFIRSIDDYYYSGKFKNISILLNDIYRSGFGYGYGYGGYGSRAGDYLNGWAVDSWFLLLKASRS
ncbi:MAG TPA: polysaccharide biosynthesis tyrosine autokinase, partial [Cyclobacteriaceae bacterium]|nr:polysaccharide biosynthesis tyrosine autokinase [Cyclobacteriaceae bacterium]